MKLNVNGEIVYFPYDYIYPEQFQYILALQRTISTGQGHCLLEMPTGTGKTVALLSYITSFQLMNPEKGKLIYCTRTVQEMDKVMEELRRVIDYRKQEHKNTPDILAVCLSSRRNMCVHERVATIDNRARVDSLCRNMTAAWVREAAEENKDIELCSYFEGFDRDGENINPRGVFSLTDIREMGAQRGVCPYFLTRRLITIANIVVFNYQYMLDPKISNMVSRELDKECIVVFDEAHNIDNICIEALTVKINRKTLQGSIGNLRKLTKIVKDLEKTDKQRLMDEYEALVSGLANSGALRGRLGEQILANPVLPSKMLEHAVPGNIRKAKHFLGFLRTIIEHLKTKLFYRAVRKETSKQFISEFKRNTRLQDHQIKALSFVHDRLHSLMRTLKLKDVDEFLPIQRITDFAQLVSVHDEGFCVMFEPYAEQRSSIPDPILTLACLDASIAMQPVFNQFRNVVITSGTLTPMDIYPKLLKFRPKVSESFAMSLSRNCIQPLIVTKGNDQNPISSKFEIRESRSVQANYGKLLLDLAAVIPDGIVVFFTSYKYMENLVSEWDKNDILDKIMQHKLVFIETQDIVETTLALDNFKKACDCGRGAIFLSVARGKVAEGIDFNSHYGRGVALFGIPYQYYRDRVIYARLEYVQEKYGINKNEFHAFDALRQASQCVGRVIRSKMDYGLMIFADSRYQRSDRKNKLPQWIRNYLNDAYTNLSADAAVTAARDFARRMAQPHNMKDEIGITMWREEDCKKFLNNQNKMETVSGKNVQNVAMEIG